MKSVKRPKGYTVPQGACSDGKYIYIVVEKKKPQGCKVIKVLGTKVVKVSRRLKVGHGNDICYRDGILYITHSKGKKVIHRVDAKTLRQKKGIKVKREYNGICCYDKGYLLREMGTRRIVRVDFSFHETGSFKTPSYTTSQGMDYNKHLYRAYSHGQSRSNYIRWYDLSGKQLGTKHIDRMGELENVFFLGEKMMCTIYRKKKVNGKMKRYIFIGEVK